MCPKGVPLEGFHPIISSLPLLYFYFSGLLYPLQRVPKREVVRIHQQSGLHVVSRDEGTANCGLVMAILVMASLTCS